MKVVLAAINAKYIHSNLAIRYLRAFTKDLNYQCAIKEFSINDREERVLEDIISEKPDLVAFSCYIWNMEFVAHVANLIKRVDESIEILYGGPEVSYDCENFLNNNPGEYVIEGEGEETFREFIEFKIGKLKIDTIKGLYYRSNDNRERLSRVYYNGERKLMNIKRTLFPYTDEEYLGSKIVYYESSRGCPFSCKYCLSSTTHGVRFLDAERVKAELQYFMDRKVRLVKFVDRTFNSSRRFAREIWSFLINSETETTFHFEISADILTMEEVELLNSAPLGRIQLEVGVQTTNSEVLKNINRNIQFEDIKIKVKAIGEGKNIKQHLDLIAGLPGEDFQSFKKSFNDVYSVQPEEIQLGFLKLLKGSSMREEAERWGITYSPYPPYEILRSNHISYEELVILKRVEEMVDKYYNSGKFNTIIKFFLHVYEEPFQFYYELGMFFHDKGLMRRNISSVDYYGVFLEFNEERLKGDNHFLKEVIKFDYLKYNKKKWLPEFLWRETDKRVENEIKYNVFSENALINKDRMHIEKFRADILSFFVCGEYLEEERYYMFDLENSEKVIDVTGFGCK
jgi:radical SAM superfamily enzyme YgiQ (UPF0313 family)